MWRLVWVLPIVTPHFIVIMARSVAWLAGVEWDAGLHFAGASVSVGFFIGLVLAIIVTAKHSE